MFIDFDDDFKHLIENEMMNAIKRCRAHMRRYADSTAKKCLNLENVNKRTTGIITYLLLSYILLELRLVEMTITCCEPEIRLKKYSLRPM